MDAKGKPTAVQRESSEPRLGSTERTGGDSKCLSIYGAQKRGALGWKATRYQQSRENRASPRGTLHTASWDQTRNKDARTRN